MIILYFVFIIAVGLTMRRRASKNMKNYFVAARRLTIPVLIGVGSASWIDSWSIVGLAECGTTMGICILFIYVIPNTILRLPLALWIGPLVRDKMPDWVITMPDLMQYMYSKNAKLVMALGMLCTLLYESALLTAGGQVISYVTGINMWVAFVILGIIIVIYTSLSGMFGLAVTDMVQFVIMSVDSCHFMKISIRLTVFKSSIGTVKRIFRVRIYAKQPERRAVDPCSVSLFVDEKYRCVREIFIQTAFGRILMFRPQKWIPGSSHDESLIFVILVEIPEIFGCFLF